MLDAQDRSSEDAGLYKLSLCTIGINKHDARPHFLVSVNDQQVNITADPGAEINIT